MLKKDALSLAEGAVFKPFQVSGEKTESHD